MTRCVLVAALGFLAGGCTDRQADRGLGAPCAESGECRDDLACSLGRCRTACRSDADCPGGACLAGACSVEREQRCSDYGCPTPTVCGIDDACRMPCAGAPPCAGAQTCFAGACFDDPPYEACASGLAYLSTFDFVRNAGSLDSAALLDVDGDGDRDFLAHMKADDWQDAWAVFSNDGHGVFTREPLWAPLGSSQSYGLYHLRGFDLDGDGRDDLMATRDASSGWQLSFWSNQNPSSPEVPIFEAASGQPKRQGAPAYCWGDIDGNGRVDFLFGDPADELRVVEVDTKLTQVLVRNDIALWDVEVPMFELCAIADLDGDGLGDVVIGAGSSAKVLRQEAGGGFTQVSTGTYSTGWDDEKPDLPGLLDFNGDGYKDLLVGGRVWLAQDAFDFGGESTGKSTDESFALLERTCSGAPSLVTISNVQSEFARVQWNDGKGFFAEMSLVGGPDVGHADFALHGDVDGDGYDDFVGIKFVNGDQPWRYVAKIYRQLGKAAP